MSLNRQRSRARPSAGRANTLPAALPGGDVSSGTVYPPSIEESLQDWLSRSISEANNSPTQSLLDGTCRCCGQHDCEAYEKLVNTVRKLEGDARLAAEIGQSLLDKHETFVVESNEVKAALEQQLEESLEKTRQLEQLLEDADNTRKELLEKNNKTTWEYQKTQKTLRETVADLEVANARCLQLSNDITGKAMEIDKLRIFKFMVRQADTREEELRAKLEDTKQELAISRKAELTLESKHKKLKSRYETVCSAYERLKLNQQELGIATNDKQSNLTWLRESNERLRNDVLKLTSAMASPQAAAATTTTETATETAKVMDTSGQNQQSHLITLIKELAGANNKLKNDLLECREVLSEARNEVIMLNCRVEELERGSSPLENPDEWIGQHPTSPPVEEDDVQVKKATAHNDDDERYLSLSAPPQDDGRDHGADRLRLRRQGTLQVRRAATMTGREHPKMVDMESAPPMLVQQVPSPTSSTSMPTRNRDSSVVHHHFHLHMHPQQQQSPSPPLPRDLEAKLADEEHALLSEDTERRRTEPVVQPIKAPFMKNSVSITSQATTGTIASEVIVEEETGSPYHILQTHVSQTLERLRATDIRALNRRLRRAFDILELSTMSNSIIENILEDVVSLRARFLWIEQENGDEPWRHDVSMEDFAPTLISIQDILSEIGQLRITMNDLQVEYVKKVKESDIRAEEEVLRKREIRRAAINKSIEGGALAWLTNMFGRSSALAHHHEEQGSDKTLVRSVSHESITAKYMSDRTTAATAVVTAPVIRRKRSDLDRTGPPSSFPRTTRGGTNNTNTSSSQPRPIPYPTLRASRSAGGSVRRSRSMQAPALEYAAVRRKKSSTLALNPSIVDISARGTPPDIDGDWKVGSTFGGTSWLGNK